MLKSKSLYKFDALQAKLQTSINYFQFTHYGKISKKISDPSYMLLDSIKDSFRW